MVRHRRSSVRPDHLLRPFLPHARCLDKAIATLFIAFIAMPALAQAPAEGTRQRVVGTVDKLDSNNLMVKANDGQPVTVVLDDNAVVFGVEKRTLADIKPGDYLASGGVKGTDGKIHAVEVRIFPETLRGTGEGQRAWEPSRTGS